MAGCCEDGNELCGLVKCGKLLCQARNCYLLKEWANQSLLGSQSAAKKPEMK